VCAGHLQLAPFASTYCKIYYYKIKYVNFPSISSVLSFFYIWHAMFQAIMRNVHLFNEMLEPSLVLNMYGSITLCGGLSLHDFTFLFILFFNPWQKNKRMNYRKPRKERTFSWKIGQAKNFVFLFFF